MTTKVRKNDRLGTQDIKTDSEQNFSNEELEIVTGPKYKIPYFIGKNRVTKWKKQSSRNMAIIFYPLNVGKNS